MKKIIKQWLIILSLILMFYSIFSIWFWEYIYYNNKILWYYWDNTIDEPVLFIPTENNNIYLYSPEKSITFKKDIKLDFFENFIYQPLFKITPNKYFNFVTIPPNKKFDNGKILLSVDKISIYNNWEWNYSIFSWLLLKLSWIFGNPDTFNKFWTTFYYWKIWNESLILWTYNTLENQQQIRISLQDTRLTDIYWEAITEIPKKQSVLLLISRFWFMKKIWYIDN